MIGWQICWQWLKDASYVVVVGSLGPVWAGGHAVLGAEPLVVRLQDGRLLRGEFAPQHDGRRLWLQHQDSSIELRSGFPWEQVSSVEYQGVWRSAAEFRAEVSGVRPASAVAGGSPGERGEFDHLLPRPAVEKASAEAPDRLARHRVRTLHLEACLGQWDSDAAADGVQVAVRPLDERGRLVPVSGTLELILSGELLSSVWKESQTPLKAVPLARRSFRLQPADFESGTAWLRLEFTAMPPEWHAALAPWGQLSARLGVAGEGIFEARSGVLLTDVESREP